MSCVPVIWLINCQENTPSCSVSIIDQIAVFSINRFFDNSGLHLLHWCYRTNCCLPSFIHLRRSFRDRFGCRFAEYGRPSLQVRYFLSRNNFGLQENKCRVGSSRSSWLSRRFAATRYHVRYHGFLLDRLRYQLHRWHWSDPASSGLAHSSCSPARSCSHPRCRYSVHALLP